MIDNRYLDQLRKELRQLLLNEQPTLYEDFVSAVIRHPDFYSRTPQERERIVGFLASDSCRKTFDSLEGAFSFVAGDFRTRKLYKP